MAGNRPPKRYRSFMADFPEVGAAYETLGTAVHAAGPLDERTRALIKLAISAGARLEGGVHSHTRKALMAGCTPEEIRHTVVLALPTLGLPNMMAALSWVDDVLSPPPPAGTAAVPPKDSPAHDAHTD